MNRTALELCYLLYGKSLEEEHKHLNLKNHCYWRIANDNTCQCKWTDKVKGVFYKNAPLTVLRDSVIILGRMYSDPSTIETLNKQSLNYRKTWYK